MVRDNKKRENEILTIEEVAAYLRFSQTTVYKLIEEEGLPAFRLGRPYRVKKTDLDEWLESRKEKTGSS